MHEPLSYSAAFLIGLLGSAHCIGMCGGIMGALAFSVPAEKRLKTHLLPILLSFNLGRIISYGLIGALVGGLAWFAKEEISPAALILRYAAGIMLILLGLYLAGWWPVLRHLESAGSRLWSGLQPIIKRFTPVKNPLQATLIGMVWGWLPCGLVYSTLVWAATAASWQQSAIIMMLFGLGTLPTLLATGILLERTKQLMQSRGFRKSVAVLVILFGIWTIPAHMNSGHNGHEQPPYDKTSNQPNHQDIIGTPNNNG